MPRPPLPLWLCTLLLPLLVGCIPTYVRIAVEAGSRMCWDRWIGRDGAFVGMNSFGASAPFEVLYKNFNITVEHIVRAARQRL